MIAIPQQLSRHQRRSSWQAGFVAMMPAIIKSARIAFRNMNPEARDEAVQEVLVSAMLAYVRLVELHKVAVAYPSALARFAVAQYRGGRRLSTKLNCNDVLSPYAQRLKNICVESLNGSAGTSGVWQEGLTEDCHAGPAATAIARIDFAAWLNSLPARDRGIATALAVGNTTSAVAQQFQCSCGRISQKRREFFSSWLRFHGEDQVGREVA